MNLHHAHTTKEKLRLFLLIMLPILVTQVGYNAMTLFDTIMSGRYGTNDLAGVAIGSNLWLPVFVAINGVLLAVTPIISQLVGAKKTDTIAPSVMQALYLAFVIGVAVIAMGTIAVEPVLQLMNLDAEVHHIAKRYLFGLSFGVIPLFLSNVLRNFFDAQGFTRITMIIILGAVPFNIVLNYLLIFGKLGFPELGGIGSGFATAVTYWLILFISIGMVYKHPAMRAHGLFKRWPEPSPREWRNQLAIGVPIGLSVFFEASIFSIMALLMGGMFDTTTIAAHQAAASWSGMMFMLPLSISMALTILVGFEVGAGRTKHARSYGRIGVTAAVGIIAFMAVLLFFNRPMVAGWFTHSADVAALTQQFLIFVIFFQLSDASQASLQGVLRGYKDVTVPFIIALVSYWGIGIPTGYALAAWSPLGPYGLWVGIIIGLSCAAAGFYVRLRRTQRLAGDLSSN